MAELSELFIYREKGEETIDNLCVVYNDLFFFYKNPLSFYRCHQLHVNGIYPR